MVYPRTRMGADFIGWRECPLQAQLGEEGFLGKLKLRAYKAVIEERVPEDQRDAVQVVVRVTGRADRELTYGSICDELDAFNLGIPECATCPLAGGKPLGCYRYVTYPVDAITERLVFEFFTSVVEQPHSIADQLYRDIVSLVDEQAGWYDNRGEEGLLAELDAPLVHSWEAEDGKHAVDSAQVLAALFIPLDQAVLVVAYARFWAEFFMFVDRKLEDAGVHLLDDALEIHVLGGSDPDDIAAKAIGSLDLAKSISDSRTLTELRSVATMLAAALQGAVDEGWTVVVDG
jgi:hypothetical protein